MHDVVRWVHRPQMRHPLLVAAFEGWNDAGDAASLALGYLFEAWGAKTFATVDPEEFYDFTATRPHTRITDGETHEIVWPSVELAEAHVPGVDRDVILVKGVEPQLKWRTFCQAIVEVASSLNAELAVTLGALLADVPHTRPVKVSGTTQNVALAGRVGLVGSDYEGPTGILGVLQDACARANIPSASFWAAVPHYVHQVPSPKAALALVERSAAVLGARVNPLELRIAAEEYERQVSERVADDEEAAAYVAQLEEAEDRQVDETGTPFGDDHRGLPLLDLDPDTLAREVERFLRQHPGSDE